MGATTWGKFYWADWESDESLKMCSPGAQALWMRMLCVCAKSGGYLTIAGKKLDADDMAVLTGWPQSDVQVWWAELKKWEVFSAEHRGRTFCRRMVKEARTAEIARENGKNGGNPNLRKGSGNKKRDNQNPTSGPTKRPGRYHQMPLARVEEESPKELSILYQRQPSADRPDGSASSDEEIPETPLSRARATVVEARGHEFAMKFFDGATLEDGVLHPPNDIARARLERDAAAALGDIGVTIAPKTTKAASA